MHSVRSLQKVDVSALFLVKDLLQFDSRKTKFSLGNPMGLIYWVSSDHARTGTSNVYNLIVVSVHNSTSACLSTADGWALNWFWPFRDRCLGREN